MVMGITQFGIGPLDHLATEVSLVNSSNISAMLGNVTTYPPPVSDGLFLSLFWQTTPLTDKAFTRETSLWR